MSHLVIKHGKFGFPEIKTTWCTSLRMLCHKKHLIENLHWTKTHSSTKLQTHLVVQAANWLRNFVMALGHLFINVLFCNIYRDNKIAKSMHNCKRVSSIP